MNLLEKIEKMEPYYAGNRKEIQKPSKKPSRKLPKKTQDAVLVFTICLTVVLAGIGVFLFNSAVSHGAEAVQGAYLSAKKDAENSIYQTFYDTAEARYHVKNEIAISVDSIREAANLEVLKVSDVEYIIQNKKESKDGITSWLEVPGEGVFTVDLQASEFVVDNQHRYILARIPNPVLSECRIQYQNVVQLEYRGNTISDSIKDGENLAQKQINEAYMKIRTEFTSNPRFFNAACSAAETMVTNLIKSLNPDIPDLTVEVAFME